MIMFSSHKFKFFLVMLLTISLRFAVQAVASSCCAGSGGQSICVLPSEQRYQLGVSTLYRSIEGHFDPYGAYTANDQTTSQRAIITTVGGAYRLNDDWQIGVSIPVIHNDFNFAGSPHTATTLGDPAIEGRYLLWEDLNFLTFRPQLTFYGGVRLPLGESVYTSNDLYDTNVTGDGTATLHAGINASKLYRPVKLS